MASRAGFDGIELAMGLEAALRGPAAISDLAAAHDLRVWSVHPPLFTLPGWSDDAHTTRIVDFASRVGAAVVVQHTPHTTDLDSSEGVAWRRAVDAARRRASDLGIALALENRAIFRGDQRTHVLADPESLYRFAEEHDYSLTLDTAHAASWPWDIMEVYDLFSDRLVNLHLSDFKSLPAWLDWPVLHTYIKHHQLPGSGYLPLRELMNRTRTDGYAGLVTLELSPVALHAWWPASLQTNLSTSVDFARDGLAPASLPDRTAPNQLS